MSLKPLLILTGVFKFESKFGLKPLVYVSGAGTINFPYRIVFANFGAITSVTVRHDNPGSAESGLQWSGNIPAYSGKRMMDEDLNHQIEKVGEELRSHMDWLQN